MHSREGYSSPATALIASSAELDGGDLEMDEIDLEAVPPSKKKTSAGMFLCVNVYL